jgi:outer membrane lipoprotein-sorting protein
MVSTRVRLLGMGLLIGAMLLGSVAVSMTSTSAKPDPDKLVEEAIESVENQPISGVRVEKIQRPGLQEQMAVAVQRRPPDQSRIEIIRPGNEANQGEVTIINQSTVWRYLADEQRAVRYENGRHWLENAGNTGNSMETLLKRYESEYKGTARVEGRDVHVVEMTPPDDTTVSLSIDINAGGADYEIPLSQSSSDDTWYVSKETWWIDKTTSYPVKQQIEWTDEDGAVVATTTKEYENLTVGSSIDDDTFSFNPRTHEEIESVSIAESERFETYDAARSEVPFSLPDPEVPNSFSLQHVTAQTYGNEHVMLWTDNRQKQRLFQTVEGDEHTLFLTYRDGADSLTIQISEHRPPSVGRPVVEQQLGDFDGRLVVEENSATIVRECGELTYRVSGLPNVDRLVEIAESMDCR